MEISPGAGSTPDSIKSSALLITRLPWALCLHTTESIFLPLLHKLSALTTFAANNELTNERSKRIDRGEKLIPPLPVRRLSIKSHTSLRHSSQLRCTRELYLRYSRPGIVQGNEQQTRRGREYNHAELRCENDLQENAGKMKMSVQSLVPSVGCLLLGNICKRSGFSNEVLLEFSRCGVDHLLPDSFC